ncbi:MAG: formylglycine-generating enzyme family protein [Pirellulales bacterium]
MLPLLAAALLAAFVAIEAKADDQALGDTIGFSATAPTSGPVIKTDRGYMVPYTATIPGTDVKFEMLPIPGGKFKLGSPAGEAKREDSEGPQVDIEVAPFWMGKYEVTWTEYERYMDTYKPFKDLEGMRNVLSFDETTLNIEKQDVRDRLKPLFDKVRADPAALEKLDKQDRLQISTLLMFAKQKDMLKAQLSKKEFAMLSRQLGQKQELNDVDAVTSPTKLYDPEQTYLDVDDKRQPAVTMTHFAARQYTKWLSKLSGIVYRLPAEAEWEYACRAGTTTAYYFGDDPKLLDEYAWHYENSDDRSHVVGEKKPNPWGLYDMHGNAAEWVLDQLAEDHYARLAEQAAGKPIAAWKTVRWPDQLMQRVVRGGGWDSDPDRCRSAARTGSADNDWKSLDPNRPLSPWWYTEDAARSVGMRLVRPLDAPSKEDLKKCWDADIPEVIDDTTHRIKVNQRGVVEMVGPQMPALVKQIESISKELEVLKKAHGVSDGE